MAHHGKRYFDTIRQVDREREYGPREAVDVLKEFARAKFDETVEMHMRLNVDPRHADQQVRGTVSLPAGSGKSVRIMVFAEGEAAAVAERVGAEYVGTDEYVKRIQDGWLDFDVAVAIPQVMGKIGRLGRVLGPRGMMPSPKAGTVVQPDDMEATLQELRQGRVEYRVDRTSNIHMPIGKMSFSSEQILENLVAASSAIFRARPASVKGRFVRRMTLTATMSPGIRLNVAETADFTLS